MKYRNDRKNEIGFLIIAILMFSWSISTIIEYYRPNMGEDDWYPEIPFQKGMSFTTWSENEFNSTKAREEYQLMRDAEIEWIAINNWWFQENLTSTEIRPGPWTDTYENITDSFLYARSIGLKILYKPMLNLEIYEWRSFIEYSPQWMDAYTQWMVKHAIAAENGGVEILSIGCEMGNMQIHSDGVRNMISEIRKVYGGLLTYSANHDSFRYIDWWDAVDIIGISMYPPMTTKFDPSLQELQNVWDSFYHELESYSAQWDRPILFTELGAQTLDGSNMVPNDNRLSTEQDIEEMRDIYLSLFQSRLWTAPWFKGTHWWIWDFTYIDENNPEESKGFLPKTPLVLDTITEIYMQEIQPENSRLLLRFIIPLVVAISSIVVQMSIVLNSNKNMKKKEQTIIQSEEEIATVKRKGRKFKKEEEENKAKIDQLHTSAKMGFGFGALISFSITLFLKDLFSVIALSFSYGIILGISPAGLIIGYIMIVLGLAIMFGLILKYSPNFLFMIQLIIMLTGPILLFTAHHEQLLIKSIIGGIIFFSSLSCFIFSISNNRVENKVVFFISTVLTIVYILGTILLLDILGLLLVVPLISIMYSRYLFKTSQSKKESKDQPIIRMNNSSFSPKTFKSLDFYVIGIILCLIMLNSGILIPIGNADYNLMNMNYLTLILSLIPSFIGALIIIFTLFIITEKFGQKNKMFSDFIEINYSIKRVILIQIIIAAIGIILTLIGNFSIIWALISGFFIVIMLNFLIIKMDQIIKIKGMQWLYSIVFILMLVFCVGIILNSIKGLLIYQFTFLEFKDGSFVTRTDFSTMPPFNIPLMVKIGVLSITIFISLILYLFQSILKRRDAKKIRMKK